MDKNKRTVPFVYILFASFGALFAAFTASMVLGAADISMQDVWLSLTADKSSEPYTIIREIRLPRELAAILVGAALSVSGAVMQGVTRNPLADPGLLGLTAGSNAALAVTIAFIPSANYFMIMVACFFGAAAGASMVFGIGAMKRGGFSPLRIVLAGAAVSAFLSAAADGISIYFKISKNVSMWSSGGLIGTTWDQLYTILPFIAAGILLAVILARHLTILSLSEEAAAGLGQRTALIKAMLFLAVIILAGAAVALAGNMAFIGLMVPHIVRAVTGSDYRRIIPVSALGGAVFMLLADTLGRTIHPPFETPVSAIAAVIGLPFFLIIVRKGGRHFS